MIFLVFIKLLTILWKLGEIESHLVGRTTHIEDNSFICFYNSCPMGYKEFIGCHINKLF